jgi:hypothetical protein
MTDEQLTAEVELIAQITPHLVVQGLNNNDELLLAFIVEMLDDAGSSELELRLKERLTERLLEAGL